MIKCYSCYTDVFFHKMKPFLLFLTKDAQWDVSKWILKAQAFYVDATLNSSQ